MLWHLVDALAIVVALLVMALAFPGSVARRWRRNFFERVKRDAGVGQSKASPRRDRSSTR